MVAFCFIMNGLFHCQHIQDTWHKIAWAFLRAGGGREEEEEGEGEEEGRRVMCGYVGKKCRLQLYKYPRKHKYPPGRVEVSVCVCGGG